MSSVEDVTAVVVNYRTLEHTRTCLDTLRTAYPALEVLAIDNGSADASRDHLVERAAVDPHLSVVLNETNVFHGPALHQGMQAVTTRLVLLLDSDVIVDRGGWLEPMVARFDADLLLYALGHRGWTDRFGYAPISRHQPHTAYIHPFAGVIDREKYAALPPFVHHGAPLYRNMWGARRAGYHLEHAHVSDHVTHVGKVTASAHGYGYDRRLETQWQLHRLENALWRRGARLVGRRLVPPRVEPSRTPGAPPAA